MADSFMIQFACNGKQCFANVYAYDSTPKEYHVHIVNTHLFSGLPENLVLIEQNEKLCLNSPDATVDGALPAIEEAIRKKEAEK